MVNYVALLAVLAATSFALPLLVRGFQAVGLQRGASVVVSLSVAAGALLLWLARAWLGSWRPAVRRRSSRPAASASGGQSRAPSQGAPAAGAAVSLADGATLRLRDAEEESRAGV